MLLLALATAASVCISAADFSMSTSALSVLEVVRSYVSAILPVVALVLCHRLIVQEYLTPNPYLFRSSPFFWASAVPAWVGVICRPGNVCSGDDSAVGRSY